MIRLRTSGGAAGPSTNPRSADSLPDLLGDGLAVRRGQDDLRGLLAAALGCRLEGDQPAGQELLGDGQAGAHSQPGVVAIAQGRETSIELGGNGEQAGCPFRHDHAFRGQS